MPKKWEKHWSKVATDDERSYRNKKLLTLGNLAIITSSLNDSVKNLNWDKKRNGTDKYCGFKEFTSGIETINKYLLYEDWNEDTITEKAEFLYEKVMKIWTL